MKDNQIKALLQLFHILPEDLVTKPERSVFECAKQGVIILSGGLPVPVSVQAFSKCEEVFGKKTAQLNETFHKSFSTVEDMTEEEYYTHQILHYFTTYGAERLGIEIPTYVPAEQLDLPEDSVLPEKLTVILAASKKEIVAAVDRYAENAVSPGENELDLFESLLPYVTIPADDIRSFELRVRKYVFDDIVPEDPAVFLRYLVYLTTKQTLLINNDDLIQRIIYAGQGSPLVIMSARKIFEKADLCRLAEIFYRYKPIFLAFKKYEGCAPYINKIRRLAIKYHRPIPEERLANAVQLGLEGRTDFWHRTLSKSSARDLLKLYNALSLKLFAENDTPGVYRIRNGKLFVKENALTGTSSLPDGEQQKLSEMTEEVMQALIERLAHVREKIFYIPPYISYAVPWSERQFVGNYPYGTRVTTPENTAFTAGIHWLNQQNTRVDLDLHLSAVGEHIGWNSDYKKGSQIIYTGDQTDAPAPLGAAEAFYFQPEGKTFALSLNQFCGPGTVDFEFFITRQIPGKSRRKKFTYDPSKNAFPPVPMRMKEIRDANLGVFMDDAFVFYGGSLGNRQIPTANYKTFIEGTEHVLRCGLLLEELLEKSGATVIHDAADLPENTGSDGTNAFTDLSPEALTPRTILDIIDGQMPDQG